VHFSIPLLVITCLFSITLNADTSSTTERSNIENSNMASSNIERPKIGLVLSGGGARGGAHLGVIKMFETYNIPIDAIAGTSMGSFIGGLYASGMSSDEIEDMLVNTDWKNHIVATTNRLRTPYRLKTLERDLLGKVKFGINENKEMVLPTGVFQKQFMLSYIEKKTINSLKLKSFDELRIPYRAIATDAHTGNEVVLSSGSLARSIYASIAIPGGFEPIKIEGKTLIDGGVVSNLPVQVMRTMGVDIIVAIDISTPFDLESNLDSYISIMGQLSNILMRKNVEDTIASLKENERLITPDLGDLTPLDADKYPLIISIGEDTIKKVYEKELKDLSLDDVEYARYKKSIQNMITYEPPIIDKIKLINSVNVSDKVIKRHIHVKEGHVLSFTQLQKDIEEIYDLNLYKSVDYHIEEKSVNEKVETTLVISTLPAYNSEGEIRFSLGLHDDFQARQGYQIKVEYAKFNVTEFGGEWRTQVGVGESKTVKSELYMPTTFEQDYFIRPNVGYLEKNIRFSASAFELSNSTDETLILKEENLEAGFGVGKVFSTISQIEVGLLLATKDSSTDIIFASTTNNSFQLESQRISRNRQSRKAYLKYDIDSFDNAWFPKTGSIFSLVYEREFESLGSSFDSNRVTLNTLHAFSYKKHTLIPKLQYGTTQYKSDTSNRDDFFSLGGFTNLSGYPSHSYLGESMLFGMLAYRYSLTDEQFFGSIGMPLYTGFTLESGSIWSERLLPVSITKALFSASAYVAADSILGPIYLAYGESFKNSRRAYLFLGSTF
jgi:NTE family protein